MAPSDPLRSIPESDWQAWESIIDDPSEDSMNSRICPEVKGDSEP